MFKWLSLIADIGKSLSSEAVDSTRNKICQMFKATVGRNLQFVAPATKGVIASRDNKNITY